MLSASELASMRATVEGSLPDLCTILAPVRVTTADGSTVTYNAIASSVPCRKAPFNSTTPMETFDAGKVQGKTIESITLPHDKIVQNDYRITITNDDTYEVIGVFSRVAWTMALRVACVKVGEDD